MAAILYDSSSDDENLKATPEKIITKDRSKVSIWNEYRGRIGSVLMSLELLLVCNFLFELVSI